MRKRNIWLDCDPGIDDAVAIALAAASQDKLKIHGISTVAGNQTSERVTDNALKLTMFLGLNEVPVVRGARGPLVRKMELADHVHGKTGLGNYELPETTKKLTSENGIQYMWEYIMQLPDNEKITLVATGPLTNIALLFKVFPDVLEKVEEVVIMGGSSVGGNVTPTAEFNAWADPEAAKIVYNTGVSIVMCGLDVTNQCGLNRKQVNMLLNSDRTVEHAYGEMLTFYFDSPAYENSEIVCIHDAVTVLYLTNRELFQGTYVTVDVDCTADINRGMTVCDMRKNINHENCNVLLLNQVDLPALQDAIMEKFNYFQ
ncbi:nucleoside hydrolase [Sporosarcina sp. UB5]|uniref:nucleoside hydrolase n=1 Tax=Sporosarcina sp. UB5 TaxID=3047463 RepID=UPI003D7B8FD3